MIINETIFSTLCKNCPCDPCSTSMLLISETECQCTECGHKQPLPTPGDYKDTDDFIRNLGASCTYQATPEEQQEYLTDGSTDYEPLEGDYPPDDMNYEQH